MVKPNFSKLLSDARSDIFKLALSSGYLHYIDDPLIVVNVDVDFDGLGVSPIH